MDAEPTTAEIRAEVEKAFRERLPAEVRDAFDEFISGYEDECKEAREKLEASMEEDAGTIADLTEALEAVKYWMLDVLVHKQPMRDPRAVLRMVEGALK
jgi:hypothetical protein